MPKMDTSAIVKNEAHSSDHADGLALLQRPVMQFLLQQHDLESLQLTMKQALRCDTKSWTYFAYL
jgi:E3 ubiquitin-protein ligase MYCBP2